MRQEVTGKSKNAGRLEVPRLSCVAMRKPGVGLKVCLKAWGGLDTNFDDWVIMDGLGSFSEFHVLTNININVLEAQYLMPLS